MKRKTMTNDYISRQDAVEALAKTMPTLATPDGAGEFDHEIHIADEAFADAIRIIESLKPADVAPVVRCKDCEHYYFADNRIPQEQRYVCEISGEIWKPDSFCSYGERREERAGMLMLKLDDAVKVAKELVEYGIDDEEVIRQELEQKCWFPPKPDKAAKHLNDLIFDINPAEICSQIESDNLKNWCKTIQTEMKMAMVQLLCWNGKE